MSSVIQKPKRKEGSVWREGVSGTCSFTSMVRAHSPATQDLGMELDTEALLEPLHGWTRDDQKHLRAPGPDC